MITINCPLPRPHNHHHPVSQLWGIISLKRTNIQLTTHLPRYWHYYEYITDPGERDKVISLVWDNLASPATQEGNVKYNKFHLCHNSFNNFFHKPLKLRTHKLTKARSSVQNNQTLWCWIFSIFRFLYIFFVLELLCIHLHLISENHHKPLSWTVIFYYFVCYK